MPAPGKKWRVRMPDPIRQGNDMPIYRVRCPVCDHQEDIFRSIKNYDDTPYHCEKRTERVMCAPFVMTDIQPYRCVVTGQEVTSRTQRREIIRSNDLIEVGDQKPVATNRKLDFNVLPDVKQAVNTVLSKG